MTIKGIIWLNITMKASDIMRNNKVLAHTAVLACFLVYVIFLANPIFSMIVNKPDTFQSQLQGIKLPAEKNNIIYVFERLGIENGRLFIIGFAFIYGQSTDTNDRIYVVFQSKETAYTFSTAQIPRYNITHPDHPEIDVTNSGIVADIPLSVLKPGTYKLGIYIHNMRGNIDVLHYTDKLVIKDDNAVTLAARTSALVDIAIPPESKDIHYGIDIWREVVHEEEPVIEISGWAFTEGQFTENCSTYFTLTSDRNYYAFAADKKYSWWVTDSYKNLGMDLDFAGFLVWIPRDKVAPGKYQVGLLLKDAKGSHFQYIGTTQIETGNNSTLTPFSINSSAQRLPIISSRLAPGRPVVKDVVAGVARRALSSFHYNNVIC